MHIIVDSIEDVKMLARALCNRASGISATIAKDVYEVGDDAGRLIMHDKTGTLTIHKDDSVEKGIPLTFYIHASAPLACDRMLNALNEYELNEIRNNLRFFLQNRYHKLMEQNIDQHKAGDKIDTESVKIRVDNTAAIEWIEKTVARMENIGEAKKMRSFKKEDPDEWEVDGFNDNEHR